MADTSLRFDVSISVESAIGDVWPAIEMIEMSRAVWFSVCDGNGVSIRMFVFHRGENDRHVLTFWFP